MYRKLFCLVVLGCLIAGAMLWTDGIAVLAAEPAKEVLVLTDISDEPVKKIKRFQPLADYLAAHLGEFGIQNGTVKVAPDIATLSQWMKKGGADLYFDSLFPAMRVCDQSGAQPILRRWKGGIGQYHSVFFTLTESHLKTIDDLKGRMIAFEEPFSTSGYMLPLAYLAEQGLSVVEKERPDSVVSDREIGYVFSAEDQNTIRWVLSRKVAAGVVDNQNFMIIPEKTRKILTVVAETEEVARQVVVARSQLSPELIRAIKEILSDMHNSDEGKEVLRIFKKTSKFDEFPEGEEQALNRMRILYELVQGR